MFSKEQSRKLRAEFWIAFGKSYPRKWILYKTGIKELTFKFDFDLKSARVSLVIDGNLETRIAMWEKLNSLKSIVMEEYLPEGIYEDCYFLENQKEVSCIYVEKSNVSIHDKNTWRETMEFMNQKMIQFEAFYMEYQEILD